MQADSAGLAYIPFDQTNAPAAKPKPKKWLLILVAAILFLIGVVAGVAYFFWTHPENPEGEAAPEPVASEFLTTTASWEKLDSPSVIWSFKADGTGELTTNRSNYYQFSWSLSEGQLKIKTAWLYELDDSFEFSFDEQAQTFTVRNLNTESVSTFVPLGTASRNNSAA